MKTIEMAIHGLSMDPKNGSPVLLLKEVDSQRVLPIWIGIYEANAIATSLAEIAPPRPMTHDLLHGTLKSLGYSVKRVVITEIKDATFYAIIVLGSPEGEVEIDSRPSDAVALAVRAKSSIFVREDVLEKSAIDISSLETGGKPAGEEDLLELLRKMDPEDYTKYKM